MSGADNASNANLKKAFSAILLLSFLVLVYSFTYSGTFLTDDEHILTSRAISLASDDEFNLSRVIGNSRVYQFSIVEPLQAQEAANVEPVQGLIGAGLVKLSILLGMGRVQTLFLLNLWTTALTAMMIYLAARRQRHSHRTSLVVSLLFGFCTIAFPYSKTFFRDSLAMFFLSCAWFFSISIRSMSEGEGTQKGYLPWLGFIVSAVLGVLTKNTILIAVPFLLLEILLGCKRNRTGKKRSAAKPFRVWLWIIIPAVIIFLVWIFIVPKIPLLSRFSPSYYWSLLVFFFSTPHPNMIQALVGPLISPGKSVFLFSPILVLALAALFARFKTSWSAWAYFVALIVFQALFYDEEWAGHVNWGLRFVIPAIPGLVLSLAPIVDNAFSSLLRKIGFISLALLSFFVQVLGVISPVKQYFVDKALSVPPVNEHALVWDIQQSPIWWSLQRIIKGRAVDFAWARVEGGSVILIGFVIVLAILIISVLFKKNRMLPTLSLAAVLGLNIAMLFVYRNDPSWQLFRSDLEQSQQFVFSRLEKGDRVVLKSYGSAGWEYWMNWTGGFPVWTSLPLYYPTPATIEAYQSSNDPAMGLSEVSLAILGKEIDQGRRVWLVVPSDSLGSELELEQKWLAERSISSECSVFQGENTSTRVCLYQTK